MILASFKKIYYMVIRKVISGWYITCSAQRTCDFEIGDDFREIFENSITQDRCNKLSLLIISKLDFIAKYFLMHLKFS